MKKKSNFWIIGIVVAVLFFIVMLGVNGYKTFLYKDYQTIHNDIDPNMPGYEIPIAKNVELVNNRVSDGAAYSKYNNSPEKYKTILRKLKEDEESSENNKTSYSPELYGAMNEFGMDYNMSYQILSAENVEIGDEDKEAGVLQMYDVEFEIILSVDGEKKLVKSYQRKIAQIDQEWIFYDEYFSIVGYLFGQRYNKDDGKGE